MGTATALVLLGILAGSPLSTATTTTTTVDTVHPHSFYWNMAGASTSTAEAGFSFYTRIFSLFSPSVGGLPEGMQMGMGGTWLTPTNISWATLPKDVCACDPKGWPSATKGDQAFGCCEKDTRCSFLYETFEGGPGYWIGMLPTATPKWRVNSAVGCYKDQTSTPLFNFGAPGKPHPCGSMGIAQLSNRMLMAPDGLTFEKGKQGMVGVAYVRTPFGKTAEKDDRNFWTVLVDTGNFAGPLGYFLPEFWGERWDSPTPSPGSAAIGDLGKPGHGLSMGGGAFEWNTLYNFKDSDSGGYKVPAMALPLGPDGQTTLFKDARGYAADDVVTPLEEALAVGKLDPSKIMSGGTPMRCKNGTNNATYRLEGSDPAHLVTVGSLHTTVDGVDGTARWAFQPLPTPRGGAAAAAQDPTTAGKQGGGEQGELPQYFSANLEPMAAADAPAALAAAHFPQKKDMGPYDGLSTPPAGNCASSPGPADADLHCVQTTSPSWIGFRWYKFVEQPAFARAKLSATEAEYLQGRVEKLHAMLNSGGTEAGKWIKERGTPEQLATVDLAQLVTPPKGFEIGYVPIAVFEGVALPEGCATVQALPPAETNVGPGAGAHVDVFCAVDLDCSLNGVCNNGACVCDPGWTGATCSTLDLLPARRANGYKVKGQSSWGGSIVKGGNGTFHMFVEEIVNGCGLNTYARNMRIAHAVSETGRADGPYRPANLVTNYSASTPHAVRDPASGDWLIFGTGCGRAVCLPVPEKECGDGVTAAAADLYPCPDHADGATRLPRDTRLGLDLGLGHAQPCTCPVAGGKIPGPECSVDWGTNVWRSSSPDGPWELTAPLLDVGHPEMRHADGTPVIFANPSGLILGNGTTMLMFRDYLQKLRFPATNTIGLAWSKTGWRGPYTAVQQQIFPDAAEDPHIYRDHRGHFHMLAHSLCDRWPDCPDVGGHAASVDGHTWRYTTSAAYDSTVLFEGGASVTFSRRERPELVLDELGYPTYLITGVVEKGGGGMEDRSWTLVQPVRRRGPL